MFQNESRSAVIVILPSLFALVVVVLLVVVCLLPRFSRGDRAIKKHQQKRIECLNSKVKAEQFVDWAKKEQRSRPGSSFSTVLCVICLEDFTESSQIRGLGCHHVFHQECLDNWFSRWNEYCPLCHRPIIPGAKRTRKSRRWDEPPPVAFMI
ncbi:hypothetical protein P280DRAFT_407141 [Massarina eburnea CBS 473.64]|uniref:RING-type domain-containing protein n=1 Tax=Massarina eburnea CBS 473.64 TaxID=1395130 RepID=A0A6A6RPP8_9PLEO|nr:hypothetical protein P280DRAFT_407141 [Massarina eburnea CBS 473.64]